MWRSGRYEQTTVSSHSANVEMVQLVSLVSPYGRCIVSGGWDGQLIVQPVRSAEEIERDQAAAGAATLANPSASLSASSTAGRTIPAAQNCGDNDASSINQSQDSSSHDRSYHETSPTTENIQQQIQKQLHKLLQAYRGNASPHGGWISCMDVSPNGRFIVSGACDGTLCLWRVVVLVMGEGEHGTRFVVEQEADPVAAAAQSRMVMLSTASHILVLPESVVRLPTGVAISCCKFVHDTCVVAGSSDSYARVFCRIDHGAAQRLQPGSTATEVRSEWILKRTLYGHRDCVWSTLPISQERLVTASRDGQAIIHDVRDCFHIESGDGETGEARPAARGERVMLFRDEPNQPLFQQADERASNDPEPSYILEAHNEALLCMEVGYGASLLALGGADKTLCVWDLKPGVQTNGDSLAMSEAPMPMRVAKCKHRHGVLSVSFLTRWRNMVTIAAGCANGDVAIWVLHERTSCEDSSASFATDRLRRKYSGISLVSVLTHNKGIPSIVCHRGVLVVVSPGDGVYVRMLDIDATSSLWKVREADMTSSTCIADTTDAPEGLPEMLLAERADVGCFEASVAVTPKDAAESRHSSRKDDKASASKHLHFNTCASPLHFNTCVSMLDGIHVGGSHCVALDDRYLVFGTNMGDVVRLDFSSP